MVKLDRKLNISISLERAITRRELAKELILEALKQREDAALSAFTEKRDVPERNRVRHQDAWGQVAIGENNAIF